MENKNAGTAGEKLSIIAETVTGFDNGKLNRKNGKILKKI